MYSGAHVAQLEASDIIDKYLTLLLFLVKSQKNYRKLLYLIMRGCNNNAI